MKTKTTPAMLLVALGTAAASSQTSTSAPKLDALTSGSSVISGMATPGAGPIDVYDTSAATRTKIGSVSMTAPDGRFYCAIKPPLAVGHKLIAIDKNGKASAAAIVVQKSQTGGHVPQ